MEILGFATGPYKTNCYVLVDGEHATIIDPGMHAATHPLTISPNTTLSPNASS